MATPGHDDLERFLQRPPPPHRQEAASITWVALPDVPRFSQRISAAIRGSISELLKFGLIGGVAFVSDLGLFQWLCHSWADSPLNGKPVSSRAVSLVVATTVSYIGNRNWTWRHRATENLSREYSMFFLINGVAMVLGIGILAFSNYVLDLRGAQPDLVANIAGIVAGTAFRFWAYKRFVFTNE